MRPLPLCGLASLLLGLTLALPARAEEHEAGDAPHSAAHQADGFPHPHISTDGSWAGALAIAILLGFFLPAAVIGPIVRANTPEEVPPAHSHDEPPGASHHHGHSGTKTEEPHH